MRVCEVSEFGGPEVLREAQRPWPAAAPGEIVVAIAATNINPTDIAARAGAHRRRMPDLEPPFVTRWDLSGVVSEVNARDSGYEVGDRVVGMIPWARIGGRAGAPAGWPRRHQRRNRAAEHAHRPPGARADRRPGGRHAAGHRGQRRGR